MKKYFVIGCLVIILFGCNNNGNSNDDKRDTTKPTVGPAEKNETSTGDDARTSLDWAGTYKGTVPCADCEGIETEIMLHSDNTYMLSTRYLGKKDANENKSDGSWHWLDGFRIELEGIKDGPSKYFVTEGRIIQLDMDGKKIDRALAEKYVLTKVK